MIEFAIKFISCSGLLYGFYSLLLREDTFFQRNRLFLLFALIVSLVLPFIDLPVSYQQNESLGYQLIDVFYVNEVGAEQVFSGSSWRWYAIIWSIISIVIGVNMLVGVIKVIRLSALLKSEQKIGYVLVYTEGKLPTFSFLHYLFWDNTLKMDELSKQSVLEHELIHIRQMHSLDLLFVQVLKVIFWFNPFLYLYAKALKNQHEFIVDYQVTKNITKQDYQHALVSVLFKNLNPDFVHSFNQSQIKKRIEKMNQMKTPKRQSWKLWLALPLLAGLMLVFSSEKVVAQKTDAVVKEAEEPAKPKDGINALIKGLQKTMVYPKAAKENKIEGQVFVSFIVNKDGTLSDIKVLKGLGHGCDEAAVNAVKNLDIAWLPAKHNGKKVRQQMTLPVSFSL